MTVLTVVHKTRADREPAHLRALWTTHHNTLLGVTGSFFTFRCERGLSDELIQVIQQKALKHVGEQYAEIETETDFNARSTKTVTRSLIRAEQLY